MIGYYYRYYIWTFQLGGGDILVILDFIGRGKNMIGYLNLSAECDILLSFQIVFPNRNQNIYVK